MKLKGGPSKSRQGDALAVDREPREPRQLGATQHR